MEQQLTSIVDVSQTLSNNVGAYIIFISIVFLVCFLFLGYQLLNIFKALLCKMIEDVFKKLETIESEIRDLKNRIK